MKTIILTALLTAALILGLSANVFAQNEELPFPHEQQLIAYYFHGTARCVTCKKIESYTEEAIRTGFPQELEDGRLIWKTLNMEESKNRHFMKDYGLYTKSVVLSKTDGGQETGWKNLDQVWQLVGNKRAFIAYIQEETRNLLAQDSR